MQTASQTAAGAIQRQIIRNAKTQKSRRNKNSPIRRSRKFGSKFARRKRILLVVVRSRWRAVVVVDQRQSFPELDAVARFPVRRRCRSRRRASDGPRRGRKSARASRLSVFRRKSSLDVVRADVHVVASRVVGGRGLQLDLESGKVCLYSKF